MSLIRIYDLLKYFFCLHIFLGVEIHLAHAKHSPRRISFSQNAFEYDGRIRIAFRFHQDLRLELNQLGEVAWIFPELVIA